MGGTASISNMGMMGSNISPVSTRPQSTILASARASSGLKCRRGLGLATVMTGTASFDHRAVDARTAPGDDGVQGV